MPSIYSETEVKRMIEMYTENPCLEVVDKLSVLLNKPRKSIISKLVKEGVYIKRGYLDKRGQLPVTKLELVRGIEDALDIKLPGLDKSPKQTLKVLNETVEELTMMAQNLAEELAELKELSDIKSAMSTTTNTHRRSQK